MFMEDDINLMVISSFIKIDDPKVIVADTNCVKPLGNVKHPLSITFLLICDNS